MLRLLGRLVFLALVLPPLIWSGVALWRSIDDRSTPGAPDRFAGVHTSFVYPLDTERWTTFPFSSRQTDVRLVSHADVASSAHQNAPDSRWHYAVAYQLLDGSGRVVAETVQHVRARITLMESPQGGIEPAGFYADDTALTTFADATVLSLPIGVLEVRARLISADPGIERVSLRVYERPVISEARLPILWRRLGEARREALAEGNVYPGRLLSEQERANLLRNRWAPVGPSGVKGADYRVRILYTRSEGEPVSDPAPPLPGLRADGEHRLVLPLSEEGGPVRLSFAPLPGGAKQGRVEVRWYGRGHSERAMATVDWSAARPEHTLSFAGGLLEIVSPAAVAVRAFQVEGGEIAPRPLGVRLFRADAPDGVVFPILHVGRQPTPFRLVLRCLCRQPVTAVYALLDHQGRAIREGALSLAPQPSPYDRPVEGDAGVSDPEEFFFNLPADVAALRLTASAPVLVTAYDRPPDVPRRFPIPEDTADADGAAATWFYLRPTDAEARAADDRSLLIEVQARPPDAAMAIAPGGWQSFVPEGDWLERPLLAPRAAMPVAAGEGEGLGTVFTPLPEGAGIDLAFVDAAELLYVRPDGTSAVEGSLRLRLFVDGRSVLDAPVAASWGRIALPAIPPGVHRVAVGASAPVRLFLNGVVPPSDHVVLRRAVRLPLGETSVAIDKAEEGEEAVVIHVFPQPGAEGRQDIAVTMDGAGDPPLGPLRQWTARQRVYSLRLGPEPPDTLVLGAGGKAGPDRVIYIPLGEDVPPGRYRLRLSLASGPEPFIAFSRSVPAGEERRDLRLDVREENGAE